MQTQTNQASLNGKKGIQLAQLSSEISIDGKAILPFRLIKSSTFI